MKDLIQFVTTRCEFSVTKPLTREPKPTVLDPNDPKAKQTHIPKSESIEEYMKRRAAAGK